MAKYYFEVMAWDYGYKFWEISERIIGDSKSITLDYKTSVTNFQLFTCIEY